MSKIFDSVSKNIPLQTRVYIHLQMEDFENWEDGKYKGDCDKLKKNTDQLIGIFMKWAKDNDIKI